MLFETTRRNIMRERRIASVSDAFSFASHTLKRFGSGKRRPVCYLPGNAGGISKLEELIFDEPKHLKGSDIFQMLSLGPSTGWEKAVVGGIGIVTPFIGPGVRKLINEGLAQNIRANLSNVPRLFQGRWRPDVAFAHVSEPDFLGRVTLGPNAGIDIGALQNARVKVAIVNKRMPRWNIQPVFDSISGRVFQTGCAMNLRDFDFIAQIDESLIEHPMKSGNETDNDVMGAIAANVLKMLGRGRHDRHALPHTLQLGIGKIPNAILYELARRNVSVRAIWSEVISDGTLLLYKNNLIRQKYGLTIRERIVTGIILGTKELYETMHENPCFAVLPQEIVNDPSIIRHNRSMASINSAIAVSLTGEVAAATIRKQYYSDVGGQFDFAYGASNAPGGIAIIALPSVARFRDGSLEPKIVTTHSEGAHHTIGADLPVVVITEHGIADLRELHDPERAEAMIRIAHPDWRTTLAKEARTLPSMQGVGVIPARLITLKNGQSAVLRPATMGDIPEIRSYISQLSDADRRTRYMGTLHVESLISEKRLTRLYHETLDYHSHAAFIMELKGEIVGIVHAFLTDEAGGAYEISFSRRSDLRGQGIGRNLMRIIIDWELSLVRNVFTR